MGSGVGQHFATHVRCRQAKHSTQVPGNDQSWVQKWSVGYEEKDQPADTSTNPTQLKVVYGVVTMSDVLNGVVPVKDGFSFTRNLVIQLHTKLNLAPTNEIRRLQGTGKSVYNPRWRDPNGNKAYEQTIVFGVDEIIINGHYQHASLQPSTKSWRWPWGSSKPKAMPHRNLRHWWRSRGTITRNLTRGPDSLNFQEARKIFWRCEHPSIGRYEG